MYHALLRNLVDALKVSGLAAILLVGTLPATPMVFHVLGGFPAYAEAPPDSDGDNLPDHSDPCPYDSSNTCFNACLTSQLQPTFLEGMACLGVAAGIVGGVVASGGGIAALGSALAASLGISGYSALMSGVVAGVAAVEVAMLMTICACLFHMFG